MPSALVVEDDQASRTAMADLVERFGFRIRVANSLAKARALLASEPCDLALVDQILRLQLVVARRGWTLRLTDVDDDLRDLMHLVGVNERLGL